MHQYIIYALEHERSRYYRQCLFCYIVVLSLSLSLGIPHNSKSLTVCYQHVVSHSKFTAPYMVYLTVYLCRGISFWVYTSSDSSLDLSPLIILRENLYIRHEEKEKNVHLFGAVMD